MRPHWKRTLLRGTLLPSVMLAALTGCGQPASPVARLDAADNETRAAGTAKFTLEQDGEGGALDEQGGVEATGVLDFASQRGTIEFDLSDMLPKDALTGDGKLRTVFDETTVYMQLPIPDMPTPWVRFQAGEGKELAQLESFSTDPSLAFAFLLGAADDVEQTGRENIRDTSTSGYRMNVDLKQAVEDAPEGARAFLEEQLDVLGPDTAIMDVWLDDDGRIRRQQLRTSLEGPTEHTFTLTSTIEYYDFGSDVVVEIPPADEVTDLADL